MYRELGDIQTDIIKKIIEMGAEKNVKKISSKTLAKECNISTATIFKKFGTMQNAIDKAYEYCDNKIADITADYFNSHHDIIEIWNYYMDVLIENQELTLYMLSYISCYKFDATFSNYISEKHLDTAKLLIKSDKELNDEDYLLLWDYILTMSFISAQKFIHYIPYTEENKNKIRSIVFDGYNALI